MVYGRNPHPRLPSFGGPGAGLPPPRDLVVLLAVVFVTFSLRFFEATRIVPQLLELTPLAWRWGWVWQLATYPLAGVPAGTLWFLVEMLILFFFGRDVFHRLGRRAFWTTLGVGTLAASVVAVAVHAVATLAGAFLPNAFLIMQGQHMLLTLVIAAFATLYGDAAVYLFFVLPVRARWFLWIEILFGFMAFLGSKDLPGFLGICAGVAATWLWLKGPGARRSVRDLWLRSQRWWLERRMKHLRRKRGFQVVPGGEGGRGGRGGGGGGGYLN